MVKENKISKVSLITSFTNIIRALIKKMVMLITDKALCVVCNKGGPMS